jgi:apolipoprotein N-acyltransferase
MTKIWLALIAGALAGLAFDHAVFAPFVWLALIPLFRVIEASAGKREACAWGMLAGACHAVWSLFWIGYVHPLAVLGMAIGLALYWGAAAWCIKACPDNAVKPIAVALVWTLLEYARAQWGYFGWNLFGYALAEWTPFVQFADVGGVWVYTFLIVWASASLYRLFMHRGLAAIWHLAVIALLCAGVYAYGWAALRHTYLDASRTQKVFVVQPNDSKEEKLSYMGHLAIKMRLRKLAAQRPSDALLVFPEAAWPGAADLPTQEMFYQTLELTGAPSLFGVVTEENGVWKNSVLSFDKDGKKLAAHAKIRLVPFGEFVPLRSWFTWIPVLNEIGDMTPGDRQVMLEQGGIKYAPLLCFEDVFHDVTAQATRDGADVLFNATDDSWFMGYPEAFQHLKVARFRAIENRRMFLRAANSGVSCTIDAHGRVVERLTAGKKTVMIAGVATFAVMPAQGLTVYTRMPYLVPIVLFVCAGLYVFFMRRELCRSKR